MFQFEHFLIRNAQMYPNRLAYVYKYKTYIKNHVFKHTAFLLTIFLFIQIFE